MKTATYTLEIITPCFCAGADPSKAEIRASSIRGQLRWWFRALGGSKSQEAELFGSVAGKGEASTLVVRATMLQKGPLIEPPKFGPNDDRSYIYHFASVSGKASGSKGYGPRWQKEGFLSPGTKFQIQLQWRRTVANEVMELSEKAIFAFLLVGSIGLRATRGLGAFSCSEISPSDENITNMTKNLLNAGFVLANRKDNFSNCWQALDGAGSLLKHTLREKFKLGNRQQNQTPLGSSIPRQMSAVYFRPIKIGNDFKLFLFEAPHKRVLGTNSQRQQSALQQCNLAQ